MPGRRLSALTMAAGAGLALLSAGLAPWAVAALPMGDVHPTPTPLWGGMLDHEPVPVHSPVPPSVETPIDGAYVRTIDAPPEWWTCLRCADYRPSGGTWRLLLDRGVLRIVDDASRWRSMASVEVHGDQLRVFNDPFCPWDDGTYRWDLQDGRLGLQVVKDECSFGLRAKNLTTGVWLSCRPPDLRAAVSDAWTKPAGCSPPVVPPPPSLPPAVTVSIYPDDPRLDPGRLAWRASANADNRPPPPDVEISRADRAVPYGVTVILWTGGPWVEMTTDHPSEAMGVQFWGPARMGVARVLFDGEEVWRGDAADLGNHLTMFGGYVEISGFPAGRHTLRVEQLGADDRPLTVMLFGGR